MHAWDAKPASRCARTGLSCTISRSRLTSCAQRFSGVKCVYERACGSCESTFHGQPVALASLYRTYPEPPCGSCVSAPCGARILSCESASHAPCPGIATRSGGFAGPRCGPDCESTSHVSCLTPHASHQHCRAPLALTSLGLLEVP